MAGAGGHGRWSRAACRSLALALAGGALLAGGAHAAEKRRPAGMPPVQAPFARQLAATFAADRVLVAARPGADAGRILRAAGARRLSRHAGIWAVDGAAVAPAAADLRARGLLRYLHRDDGRMRPAAFWGSSEPLGEYHWWAPAVGADVVQPPGPGVPVVVVDDGLDVGHPEFAGRPETVLLNGDLPHADDGHGTMVASVAAAPVNGHGIAGLYPQARLRSWDYGSGSCEEVVAGVAASIEADDASVINFSGGFSEARDCYALYDVVAAAFGRGHLIVASAGNDGGSRENFPASYPHVITVAATDDLDATSGFSTRSLGIDLAAPGEAIPAAVPLHLEPMGYLSVDGTSFAAPLVSAAAAWTWTTRGAELGHVTQLFELLRSSARDVGSAGWDQETGFGVLSLPGLASRAMPAADASEPNDDVDQVVPGRLFAAVKPPLLGRGRTKARIGASLDWTEDPVDVYRVWVPARRTARLRVTANADVDLEVFRPTARTVHYDSRRAARRGTLVGGSYRSGRGVETFAVTNGGRKGAFYLVCVYKGEESRFLDARYTLRVAVGT